MTVPLPRGASDGAGASVPRTASRLREGAVHALAVAVLVEPEGTRVLGRRTLWSVDVVRASRLAAAAYVAGVRDTRVLQAMAAVPRSA
jgi:hypothetical protein